MKGQALDAIFRPESIAVIGASRSPGTVGYQVVDNLQEHGYPGVIYPVNPNARAVHSIPAYPSVLDVPGSVDLGVIVVPKELVLEVVDQCGEKGVRALVVITAGFREEGSEGARRERALMERVRKYGMRLVGPNCMGVLNTDPALSMNATFAPTMPPPGPVGLMSQSGAIGVTILDYAAELGIGIHEFASVGNKPDVSGNDLIEYWENDPKIRVILMYLENFGNPRRFTPIARRVSRKKPIVVVKSGRTHAGALAASSHTGALAGMDVATDALLAQCGVQRADTVEALFDMAMAFGSLPVPAGNRVAVVTNAGGPGIIIADACEAGGLRIAPLGEATQARLRENLPEEASVRNPVDMIATATPESYRTALAAVLQDPDIDAAIAAFVPPLRVRQQDVAVAIVQAVRENPGKPVLAVLMGREGLPEGRAELQEAGIPAYSFPESAANALAAMHRYARWLDRPLEEPRTFAVDRERVREILDGVQRDGREHLTEPEGLEVFQAYGIPTVPFRVARSGEEAVGAAEELGFPVVLKTLSPGVVHKSDVGGVAVDLRSPAELREAYAAMKARLQATGSGAESDAVLVQPFLQGGRETILGVTVDPSFGPVMMFGLGGVYVEALGDVTFRVQPVSEQDARDMVRSIRGYRLLEGVRGEPGVDQEALVEAIQRISTLVMDHERIVELDINPFLAFEEGARAVDARIRLSASRSGGAA